MKNKIIAYSLLLSSLLIIVRCAEQDKSAAKNIQDEIINNEKSFFYIDFKNYPQNDEKLPIGIFDSGTGGLTVLDAIVNFDQHDNSDFSFNENGDGERDFQQENFIYLGDKANMPYGEYSGNNKTSLLKEHIIKDVQFLLGEKYYRFADDENFQTDKQKIKALVIACNTATAYGKNDIEKFLERAGLDLKVIGVIGAGVRGALSCLGKNEDGLIGIMATAGTVASNGYPNTIKEQKKQAGFSGNISSVQQAGIGLAAAVDGEPDYINAHLKKPRPEYRGPSLKNNNAKIDINILERYGFNWDSNFMLYSGSRENPEEIQLNSVENYIRYHVVSLMENIRLSGADEALNSIILGCTHYPFFISTFKEALDDCYNYQENNEFVYRSFMLKDIKLIDPAVNTAKELFDYLNSKHIFNDGNIFESEFYISLPNLNNSNNVLDEKGNFKYEYKYGRRAGEIQQYVKRIPFSKSSIQSDVLLRLEKSIPFTFDLIKSFDENNFKTKYLNDSLKI